MPIRPLRLLARVFPPKRTSQPPVGLALRGRAFERSVRPAWPRRGVAQPSLERCLVLAMLLHILLFLVVGTAPGGDAPAGARRAGELAVFLPDAARPTGTPPSTTTADAAQAPAPSASDVAGERTTPPIAGAHVAAGTPQQLAQAGEPAAVVEPSIVIRDAATPMAPAPDAAGADDELPLLVARKAPVVAGQASSALPSGRRRGPAPAASAVAPAPRPAAAPVPEPEPAASEPPEPAPIPLPVPAPLPAPLSAPLPTAATLPKPNFAPLQVPVTPPPPPVPVPVPAAIALPAPAPLPAPLATPLPTATPLPRPSFTPLQVPVAPAPVPVPAPAPAPAPAPIALPAPAPLPAPLTAPLPSAAPLPKPSFTPLDVPVARPAPAPGPVQAPPAAKPAPAPEPVAAPAPVAPRPIAEPAPAAPVAGPATQSVRPVATPAERGGAGGAATEAGGSGRVNLDGSSGGSGPGTAQSATPGASAPLNLDLHGGIVGPGMGRTRSGLVPVLPAPADKDRKTQLETDIEKAARKDCKDAYSGAGLLAVIPLAKDAVTGKGCKW